MVLSPTQASTGDLNAAAASEMGTVGEGVGGDGGAAAAAPPGVPVVDAQAASGGRGADQRKFSCQARLSPRTDSVARDLPGPFQFGEVGEKQTRSAERGSCVQGSYRAASLARELAVGQFWRLDTSRSFARAEPVRGSSASCVLRSTREQLSETTHSTGCQVTCHVSPLPRSRSRGATSCPSSRS